MSAIPSRTPREPMPSAYLGGVQCVLSFPCCWFPSQGWKVDEIIFVVEEAPEGGYVARALGASIFAEADDLETLQAELRDAVHCHFENDVDRPRIIRLHLVRDRLLAV